MTVLLDFIVFLNWFYWLAEPVSIEIINFILRKLILQQDNPQNKNLGVTDLESIPIELVLLIMSFVQQQRKLMTKSLNNISKQVVPD